jgi:hypothetical protein
MAKATGLNAHTMIPEILLAEATRLAAKSLRKAERCDLAGACKYRARAIAVEAQFTNAALALVSGPFAARA